MSGDITLPPLPLPDHAGPNGTGTYFSAWTETQVRDAQRAAILLDRQQRAAPSAEPVAWIARYTDRAGNPRGFTHSEREVAEFADGITAEPLYAAPPDHTALLRQALDALEKARDTTYSDTLYPQFEVAIDALRKALEGK